jgi:hypothetical protein
MRRRRDRLECQSWWTSADEAELDLLVHELVLAVRFHRERCPVCATGEPGGIACESILAAVAAVIDWRRGRILRSRARWLRERRTDAEAAA